MIRRLVDLHGAPSTHPEADALAPPPEPRFRGPVRIRVTEPVLDDADVEAVAEVVRSGFVSSAGPAVAAFEAELARTCQTTAAFAVTCGTHALELVLHCFDLRPGDEVVVPALTFVSVAAAVARCGARPVFADVDPRTLDLTPDTVQAVLSPRTRGVIAVHTYGHPADMDGLKALTDAHGLFLVEDVCEALGAEWRGRPVGGLGDVAVHSFYANKMMTTGNGGAITTSHPELAALLRKLRGYSYEPPRLFWHAHPPFNVRMSALQAALGRSQLQKLPGLVAARERVAAQYDERLSGVPGLSLPATCEAGRHARWMYVLQIDPDRFGCDAAAVRQALADAGIETRAVFAPLHVQPALQEACAPPQGPFPAAARAATTGLLLPSGPGLARSDVDAVCDVIRACARAAA